MTILVHGFNAIGYRLAGGGIFIKVVDQNGNVTRFGVGIEILTHLQSMIQRFVHENDQLRNPNLTPAAFWENVNRTAPAVGEEDFNGMGPKEFKTLFDVDAISSGALLRTMDLEAERQDFQFTFEQIEYLGLKIAQIIERIRY
ncbi:hypothetical protein ACC734_28280 [Rhizobium ruizarguesonis]|uniref:hypothetical protein n=1 Tax=Rhizobium brockwellii TaxID=3019932 RepID=UPI003F9791CE